MNTLSNRLSSTQHPAIKDFTYPLAVGMEPAAHAECLADARLKTPEPCFSALDLAAAREEGKRQGEDRARALAGQEIAELRGQITGAMHDFAQQRTHYFGQVEGQVVQLALAMARRILQREAQVDPLLLSGLVRVALEKVQQGGKVVLCVPENTVAVWQDAVRKPDQPTCEVEVTPDPSMQGDTCRLKIEGGEAELSIQQALSQFELSFLELLGKRTGAES